MKIIVTGGAGFIGSNLVEKLVKEEHDIIVLDNFSTGRKNNLESVNKSIKLVECNLSIKGDWSNYFKNIDWVFHLAALADVVPSIENPIGYFESNVTATLNVLEASRKFNVKKIIYSASSSCYGIPNEFPTKETATINTEYPYALTKYLGERLLLHWGKVYDIDVVSLRFFNVYGPKARTSGTYGAVFGIFLAQKLANKPFTVVGDGSQTRDFTFVSDVVDALLCAANSILKNEVINIGSNNTYSVNYLVELLQGEVVYIPKRPGEPDCTWADISKAKKIMKWQPKISFKEGITILVKNINYWKEAPVWDKVSISKATEKWFKYLDK